MLARMPMNNSLFSGRRFSRADDEPPDTEAFEIAVEMSSGEPLHFSDKTIREHVIDAEYALVCRDPVDGLYVVPSSENPFEWLGVLFIRRGVYVGAVLRFSVFLPSDFPSTTKIPKVIFELDVFHPHVDITSRELNLKRYFVDGWKADKHHVHHVLLIVQRTFFSFDADISSSSNPEAAAMLQNDKEGFKARVREVIKKSRSIIYDPPSTPDRNAIRFSPWDASVHEPLRQRLIGGLTDSQISTMSMLGSLGYGPTGTSVFESRGKAGFSWVSASELSYMVEQPRPAELELRELSEYEEKTPDSASSCHSSTQDTNSLRLSHGRLDYYIEKLDLKELDSSRFDSTLESTNSSSQACSSKVTPTTEDGPLFRQTKDGINLKTALLKDVNVEAKRLSESSLNNEMVESGLALELDEVGVSSI